LAAEKIVANSRCHSCEGRNPVFSMGCHYRSCGNDNPLICRSWQLFDHLKSVRDDEMILRKVSLTKVVVFLFILLLFDLSFSQIRSETTVCFSGVIKSISGDYKFLVVNDVNI
jgi:hypothetical protein